VPPGLKALAAVPQEPIPEPIPLSVLTGFLGSGKTTFLGRVLASPDLADTAVVISEFGAVALDHLLLETESEGIVDLPNGCTCCAVRQGLADTLYRLVDRRRDSGRPPFRRIALETSGLADPAPILYTLSADAYLEASLRLDRIVTTIDTIAGPASLARFPEATAADDPARVRHGAGAAGPRARRKPAAREGTYSLRRRRRKAGRHPCRAAHALSPAMAGGLAGRRPDQPPRFHRSGSRAGDDPGPFHARRSGDHRQS
jgi:hypothetical protein